MTETCQPGSRPGLPREPCPPRVRSRRGLGQGHPLRHCARPLNRCRKQVIGRTVGVSLNLGFHPSLGSRSWRCRWEWSRCHCLHQCFPDKKRHFHQFSTNEEASRFSFIILASTCGQRRPCPLGLVPVGPRGYFCCGTLWGGREPTREERHLVHCYGIVAGKRWVSAQLWALQHFLLGRATLSDMGRVAWKSYSPAPVACVRAKSTGCYNKCKTFLKHCFCHHTV